MLIIIMKILIGFIKRYIRVSCGLDANYAAPIKGVFYGNSNQNNSIENLDIYVQTLEYNSQQ